jgi:very-short-patch-repair endonuclease/YHS domain-containing protein
MKNIPFERSFASHPKSKFWSNKNKISPKEVTISNGKKYWFNCNKCKHHFEIRISGITNNTNWCHYCSGHRICKDTNCKDCFERSFASHSKSIFWSNLNKILPIELHKYSNDKCWFDCDKCTHSFEMTLAHINEGKWCSYCASKILCNNESCKECLEKSFAGNLQSKYWSDKNELTAREVFRLTNKQYYFNCNLCIKEFIMSPNQVVNQKSWCPTCKNKTALKLFDWLKDKYKVETQKRFDWTKTEKSYRRYDFCITKINLLIELDGPQHFIQVSNWTSPEKTSIIDEEKNNLAIENGFSIIRICQKSVLLDKEDWENKLLEVINNLTENPSIYKIGSIYY